MPKNRWKIFLDHYDLGQLIHTKRSNRGYINITYEIETLKDGKMNRHFLRIYRKGTLEEKIMFEHALLNELFIRGFEISPRLIPSKSDKTYVMVGNQTTGDPEEYYMSVFSCLPGKDKYSWDDPICTYKELSNAAKILALYHNTIFEWKGITGWKDQRTIEKILLMPKQWRGYSRSAGTSPFDHYFLEQFDYLVKAFQNFPKNSFYNSMPHLVVHGDYHPGNLKFQDEEVSGVFDFDWSKIDARSFDVGCAIFFFCTAWEGNLDGTLLLHRVDSFLEAYQGAAKEMKRIGPLNRLELEYLPEMIHMSNLSIIDWIISEFYSTNANPQKYLYYLQHSVRLIRWLEGHRDQLYERIMKHRK